MASNSTSAIDDGHRTQLTLTPGSRTVNATDPGLTTRPAELADFVPQWNRHRDMLMVKGCLGLSIRHGVSVDTLESCLPRLTLDATESETESDVVSARM